ncbi:MAG: hypothetical protein IKF64_01240 [Eubacterium sp.]|nr:hypothetical protein [Eubacterium sp.]
MKNNKKILSLVLTVLIIGASLTAGIVAYAGSPVAINAANFPDANFRTIVAMECDEDEDGYLSDSERTGVTLFSVTGYLYDLDEDAEIEDLKGIEYFTNLRTLRCGGIGLKTLNVSALTNLTWLDCMGNELSSLDVSHNTALTRLNCQSNDLSALNVSMLTNLVTLSCSVNKLTSLNVSNNTNLETLQVHQNQLTSLNVSNNTKLTSIHCSNNHIQELDLSANTLLENVTSNRIGDQLISGEAVEDSGYIYVTMPFNDRSRIISTSIDPENNMGLIGYQSGAFVTDDYKLLEPGIDYEYDTGLDGAEPFTVHIDVIRNFFFVKFYTNENKQTLIGEDIVYSGETATPPDITETPQCKTFVAWSDTYDNIVADKEIYATWRDDHIFAVTGFAGNIITMSCLNGCGTTMQMNFADVVGAELGDSNYYDAIDLNYDGIINGKDLAYLKQLNN